MNDRRQATRLSLLLFILGAIAALWGVVVAWRPAHDPTAFDRPGRVWIYDPADRDAARQGRYVHTDTIR